MTTRNTLATLVALVGLLGLVLVNVGGASGLHDGPDTVMRLHLDADGDYFAHDGLQQDLTETSCLVDEEVRLPDSLVSLSGSNKGLGLSFDSLGVRSKGPGRSCGRVDPSESFTITINNAPTDDLADLNFDSVELDIEAKQDAWVQVTAELGGDVIGTFELRTGSSVVPGEGTDPDEETGWLATSTSTAPIANCLGLSDSGSDNGLNDNCRWVIDPDIPFDTVTFQGLAGEFGLEGGEDGTLPATAGENSDSLFYLTDVAVLACGETANTPPNMEGDLDPIVSVLLVNEPGCQPKLILLRSSADDEVVGPEDQSFTFDPAGQEVGTFEMTVTWVKEPAVNPLPITQMDYNGDGDATDEDLPIGGVLVDEGNLLWCDGTTAEPSLPSTGEPWCRVEQHVTLVSTGYVQVVEDLLGTGDPNGWR